MTKIREILKSSKRKETSNVQGNIHKTISLLSTEGLQARMVDTFKVMKEPTIKNTLISKAIIQI